MSEIDSTPNSLLQVLKRRLGPADETQIRLLLQVCYLHPDGVYRSNSYFFINALARCQAGPRPACTVNPIVRVKVSIQIAMASDLIQLNIIDGRWL